MSIFEWMWVSTLCAGLLLLAIHPFVVHTLSADCPKLYEDLGRPGYSYASSGAFFTFGIFTQWLLALRPLTAPDLSRRAFLWSFVEAIVLWWGFVSWIGGGTIWIFQRLSG